MTYILHDIPTLNICKFIPKILGQDTKPFQGWSGRQHDNRKCILVESDRSNMDMIHYLTQTAKNRRLFEKYWGPNVYVATIVDNKVKKKGTQNMVDMAAMASFSRRHINYSGSTRMGGISCIWIWQSTSMQSWTPSKLVGTITY